MKNFFCIVQLCVLVVMGSCSKDDAVVPNTPPNQVKNIIAESLGGTMVKINWDASTDAQMDEVLYDVVVNDLTIANGLSDNFIAFDAVQFLETEMASTRGATIDLTISIIASDDQEAASEPKEIKTSVYINSTPSSFSFKEISFDVNNYDWIEIRWNPSTDVDGDSIRYDIYLDDLLIEENYMVNGTNGVTYGYFYYEENFESYVDREFSITVIAKDEVDASTEISRSYNFRASDQDLGQLSSPFQEFYEVEIVKEEIDHKVGYRFSIAQETGYSISLDENNAEMFLSDQTGNLIGTGHYISDIRLVPGDYYLELVANSSNADVQDSLSLTIRDINTTDVDLGLLEVPYQGQHNIEVAYDEPDQEVNYSFETDKLALFSISTNVDAKYYLSNNNKVVMKGNLRNFNELLLPPGSYVLRVENTSYQTTISGPLTIYLNEDRITDVDFGILYPPVGGWVTFDIAYDEPDNAIGYTFELETSSGMYVQSFPEGVVFTLYSDEGTVMATGYGSLFLSSIPQGSYYLEVNNTTDLPLYGEFYIEFNDFSKANLKAQAMQKTKTNLKFPKNSY